MANGPFIARVENGRLVLDVPTALPEGTEIALKLHPARLDDEQRAALHEAIRRPLRQLEAGEGSNEGEVIAGIDPPRSS